MKKGVIIQASSRSKGDTNKIVTTLQKETGFDVIDLRDKDISHFDYEFKNKNDDFKYLFDSITANYEVLVFATPIYWYTMSGLMKVFFDRISDFLNHDKAIGRRLRTKSMAVISCSNDDKYFSEFAMPFEKSASYLGMNYLGHLHTWVENETISQDVKTKISEFVNKSLTLNV